MPQTNDCNRSRRGVTDGAWFDSPEGGSPTTASGGLAAKPRRQGAQQRASILALLEKRGHKVQRAHIMLIQYSGCSFVMVGRPPTLPIHLIATPTNRGAADAQLAGAA